MELKWIQISLFLTALLHFTEAAGARHRVVRAGDDVTLSCENVIRNQPECSFTDWVFGRSTNSASVKLVTRGQIDGKAGAKSDRLRVTVNCSLLIKKVTEEDVGRYVCQQYPTYEKQVPDSVVDLSVLIMEEMKNRDDVTLRCFVMTYELHTCGVKWLYEGKEMEEHHCIMRTPQRLCYTYVSLQTNHFIYKSGFNSLQCEVTVNNNKQLFPAIRQPSGKDNNHEKSTTAAQSSEKPPTAPRITEHRVTAETTPTPENKDASDGKGCRCCSGLDLVMLALRVSELVLVSLLTVLLFRARGNQKPPGEIKKRFNRRIEAMDYENVKECSASSRLH